MVMRAWMKLSDPRMATHSLRLLRLLQVRREGVFCFLRACILEIGYKIEGKPGYSSHPCRHAPQLASINLAGRPLGDQPQRAAAAGWRRWLPWTPCVCSQGPASHALHPTGARFAPSRTTGASLPRTRLEPPGRCPTARMKA